jgi:hypothetical protein
MLAFSDDMHSMSKQCSPASIAWVRTAAGRLDDSYAQINVSSKSTVPPEDTPPKYFTDYAGSK